MGVSDVTASLNEIAANGGSVDVSRFEVPGVVVLGLFRDSAGNTMGLMEMNGDEIIVPKYGPCVGVLAIATSIFLILRQMKLIASS